MHNLRVFIEINKKDVCVGSITGNSSSDAMFRYDELYLKANDSKAISISLPLRSEPFSTIQTKNYFEGLLPEGFSKKSVANNMHVDEDDYLSILHLLGRECLGAIKIVSEDDKIEQMDYIKLSKREVKKLALEGSTKSTELITKAHLSLTGASGKVGLYFDGKNWYLPVGSAPSTHIVKQSHIRLSNIICNEMLCILTAQKLGIDIPDCFIVNTGNFDDNDILYATKRYDRFIDEQSLKINGLAVPYRLHQEDFSQAMGISSSNKYEKNNDGYMKKVFNIIHNYSFNPIDDQMKMWKICIFNYLIGNTDNHIKNYSLLYSNDLKRIRLAPAYDIISTIIYENSSEDMAMSIGGEYDINKINRKSFELEARNIGMGINIALTQFDIMKSNFEKALKESTNELYKQGFKEVKKISKNILEKNTR